MRPCNIIKNLLVHHKDKRELNQMCGVVYDIRCNGYDKSDIGETGRAFGTGLNEHQSDADTGLCKQEVHQGSEKKNHLQTSTNQQT